MSLFEIFSIIIIHFIADFVLQTNKQAKGKSSNWSDLLEHTFTYTTVWWVIGVVIIMLTKESKQGIITISPLIGFTLITFTCHTITDYFTSRLNKKLWESNQVHNFFVGIGFDQVLHYIQLFLTYYYITKL